MVVVVALIVKAIHKKAVKNLFTMGKMTIGL